MLIYILCAQCSLYDWAERGAESPIFFWMCPSTTGLYLLFLILVKHSSLALFKTLHATSGILYQEASGYKISICCSRNFVFSFSLLAAEEVNA